MSTHAIVCIVSNLNLVSSFYGSYLAFFVDVVLKQGASKAVEMYIFADEVNTPSFGLIGRFVNGLIHPVSASRRKCPACADYLIAHSHWLWP